MKPTHDWHVTPLGRVVCFLGSIQLAVPVLALVAAALAWGTYLESVHDSKVSRATVYGSWWFITLMGLICVSLVFAVVTRYPWKRKHVGFITVHAGLILLIIGGFWSLFGRLEGHVALEEGNSSNSLETDQEVLELAQFNAGKSTIVATVAAPTRPTTLTLDGVALEVIDHWGNTREEQYVANDGPEAFRAIEITFDPNAKSGDWIGDEAKGGGGATIGGVLVRVLADGATWEPPAAAAESKPGYFFTLAGTRYPLGEVGSEAVPGWTIVSIQKFAKAMVAGGKITEGSAQDNPAVDVTITDGQGTTERHTCFQNFPDMVMGRTLEGAAKSGASLGASAPAAGKAEALVIFGPVAAPRVGYIGRDGVGRELPAPTAFPAALDLGSRRVTILNHFNRARAASRFVQAPKATERRPALVMKVAGVADPVIVPWKGFEPIPAGGRNLLLRYGPRMVELPFTIQLKDFRKMDYPGTEMAMAYESDVIISTPGQPDAPYLIHMNTPFAHSPWKVYQSGFMGEQISVFSVMRDPGLTLTYIGSIVLCVGIFVTFFSRSLSWGHPGIPAPSLQKEASHAPKNSTRTPPPARAAPVAAEPVSQGV
ncbi:hypothetical protein PHYC_00737 [Phycisphaerales bacterium]|nr:hypothetical protein PHYC_00737 [Phycisphaerales bacterium]